MFDDCAFNDEHFKEKVENVLLLFQLNDGQLDLLQNVCVKIVSSCTSFAKCVPI